MRMLRLGRREDEFRIVSRIFSDTDMKRDVLGLRASGTVSNISVSMFAWIAQFADASLSAVTKME